MAYEAYWDNVTVALRFDAPTIVCDKGTSVVPTDVTVDTSDNWFWPEGFAPDPVESFAVFNTASVSNVSVAAGTHTDFGSGDFTIVMDFRRRSNSASNFVQIGSDPDRISVYGDFGGANLRVRFVIAGVVYDFTGANTSPTQYVAHQLMVVRFGQTAAIMLDGVVLASSATLPVDALLGLGSSMTIGYFNSIAGYLVDDFFVVKGVALETGAYTPAPLFVMSESNVGTPTMPLVVNVSGVGTPTLPITVRVGVTGTAQADLTVVVVDPAYLAGETLASDGGTSAGAWMPVVMIDGVDRTDDVIGDIETDAQRGSAAIATFTLAVTGLIDPSALVGQPVSIDIADAAGIHRMRLFTGRINTPTPDMIARTITLVCTDDLQNIVNAMPRAALDALVGGRWSAAVFDPAASSWVYAQDRLSTVPASLDLSPWGALRVTPWTAGTIDMSFDGDIVVHGSLSTPQLAERSALLNRVDLAFGYRFPRTKREAHRVTYSYLTNGLGPWVDAGNYFLSRQVVLDAIEAAGGQVESISWIALPTTTVLLNLNGMAVPFIPNPVVGPTVCLGFDAVVTFDYTQEVDEAHAITITSPASIAAVGTLRQTMSGALRGETADTLAVETNAHLYQLGLSQVPPIDAPAVVIGQTTAAVMTLTDETSRTAAETAIETLVDIAKVKIINSHYDTTIPATVPLHPLVELGKTVSVVAHGVSATGRVSRVRHRMSPTDTAWATTEFELSLCRLSGVGIPDIESPTVAPDGVSDGATGPLPEVVCQFNGLAGQDASFEVTFPAVASGERETARVDIASSYIVALVEDDLIMDMGA